MVEQKNLIWEKEVGVFFSKEEECKYIKEKFLSTTNRNQYRKPTAYQYE